MKEPPILSEEHFCSFQAAKLLKQAGFHSFFTPTSHIEPEGYVSQRGSSNLAGDSSYVCRPTHQVAVDFLLKNHDWWVTAEPTLDFKSWIPVARKPTKGNIYANSFAPMKDRWQAMEKALIYVLECLINNPNP